MTFPQAPADDDASLHPPHRAVPPAPGEGVVWEGRTYWFGRRLARTRHGPVFECTDEWSNALMARAVSANGRVGDALRAAWERERDLLTALRHPKVIALHDAFEYRGAGWLVFERCDARVIHLIARDDLHAELWIYPLARSLLQALESVHGAGYVHHDVHPESVYVAGARALPAVAPAAAEFRLGDFAAARSIHDPSLADIPLPSWLPAPEVIDPVQFGVADHRVDVYHAALTLLSLLLRRLPAFTVDEILGGAPQRLAERSRSRYGAAIARALSPQVELRTHSARGLWRDIRRVG